MRVIVAGSRSITDYPTIASAIDRSGFQITELVSGQARGVDSLGERWAREHSTPIHYFPAQWETYGRSAGYRRNRAMSLYADALILIWDGRSRGSSHMLRLARYAGLRCFVVRVH